MNRRQKIIVSVTGIFIVLLILVGLTYAYFLTKITGNENDKSISVTTANLSLVYEDGTSEIITSDSKIVPGQFTGTKTFTVTNTGNATVENYAVILEDVVNPLDRPQDMEMTLTCSSNLYGDNSCSGTEGSLPNQNGVLVYNSIEEGEIQTYTFTISYVDPGVDQSSDMGKTIEGKLNIMDSHNTLDLTGTVATVSEGDYVQVNSEPRVSQIVDGTYKVVGLEPGTHTIGVYGSDGTLKGSKTFTINKTNSASVSGTTINISDYSRLATIDINTDYSISIGSEIIDADVIKKGTLAYEILNNAKLAKDNQNDTSIYGATETPTIYSPIPKSSPAATSSGSDERTLSTSQDDYGISYYYRGNVQDNYVNFSGMCWRAVRIQGNGTVKLVLFDETGECGSTGSYGTRNALIARVGFSSQGYYPIDDGGYEQILNSWMNGGTENVSVWDGSWSYYSVSKAFTSHISESNQEKLFNNEWCKDFSRTYNEVPDDYYEDELATETIYGAYNRLQSIYSPTFKCNMTGDSNSKALKESSKIGLLTADEVAFAGLSTKSNASNNYLLYNSEAYTITPTPAYYWSGTWHYFYSQYDIYRITNEGKLEKNKESGGGYVRPSIVLKNTVAATGIGTLKNPYVIK